MSVDSREQEVWRGHPTRERGRPARMHPRCMLLNFLGWGTRPPCRRERHVRDRSRVPAPVPVELGGGEG
ncbi:MAG: hypothetical protein F4X19_01570 [Acidobacteria bacterium]|nr:hypothetical protein [Acidobacteriota bacterium]